MKAKEKEMKEEKEEERQVREDAPYIRKVKVEANEGGGSVTYNG